MQRIDDGLTSQQRYCLRHPERVRENQMKCHHLLRMKAIEYLGGKCVNCGESDWRCLQFDHINGGGNREKITGKYSEVFRDILSGKRPDIQLLCANCNWKKRYENKEYD